MSTVEVRLARTGPARFLAQNSQGQITELDGPPALGGQGGGMRPMELLLVALAGCSALDLIHILEHKQRQRLTDLEVSVRGVRADSVPAVYTSIHLSFSAAGQVDPNKLQRAVALSMEKYCSVARMLHASATITFEAKLRT